MLGDVPAGQAVLHDAREVFRRLGVPHMIAATLQAEGVARLSVGDATARELLRESLDIYRTMPGTERAASHIALNLGEADFIAGRAESALSLAREALNAYRSLDDRASMLFALNNVAAYLCAMHRTGEAAGCAREAIAIGREAGVEVGVVWALQHLVAATVQGSKDGDARTESKRFAARLLGFVDEWIAQRGIEREYTEQREYEYLRWTLSGLLGDDEAEALLGEGSSWEIGKAMEIAAEL